MTLLLLFALLWVTSAFIPLSFLPRASNSRKAVYGPFCKVYTTSRASLEHPTDIRGEISSIVEQVVNYSRNRNGLSGFDPKTLMEHAHIITQGNEYESVIQAKLEAAHGADEVADLKNADALLKGFIQSERKQRARLKMNYILAGAETGRLDDAIQLLSDRYEPRTL